MLHEIDDQICKCAHLLQVIFLFISLSACFGGGDQASTAVDTVSPPPSGNATNPATIPPPPAANSDPSRWSMVAGWRGQVSITYSENGRDRSGFEYASTAATSFKFESNIPGVVIGRSGIDVVARGTLSESSTTRHKIICRDGSEVEERTERTVQTSFIADTSNRNADVAVDLAIVSPQEYMINPFVMVQGTVGKVVTAPYGCTGMTLTSDVHSASVSPGPQIRRFPLPAEGWTLSGAYSIEDIHDGLVERYQVSWNIVPSNIIDDSIPNSCTQPNASLIRCENQALNKFIPISGIASNLAYSSDRVQGRAGANIKAILHSQQLGGWSLSEHHAYDPASNTLFNGNGSFRDATDLGTVPLRADNTYAIASQDADSVFVFNGAGRHLRTVNAVTGASLLEFRYDSDGRVLSIRDGDANLTQIERNAEGSAAGIIGPFGQRTVLAVDTNGYLATVTNPAGEVFTVTYGAQGLLTSMSDPLGSKSTYIYDPNNGRLFAATDAAAGWQALQRTDDAGSFTVVRSTAGGQKASYVTKKKSAGGEERTITSTDGLVSQSNRAGDGSTTVMVPDGLTEAMTPAADSRFGLSAPTVASYKLTMPSGLTATAFSTRSTTLADPANLFRAGSMRETTALNGRLSSTTYDDATRSYSLTSPTGRTARIVIDTLSRPLSLAQPDIVPTALEYDVRGRLTRVTRGNGQDVRTTGISYDSSSNVGAVTDSIGRQATFAYDAVGRTTQAVLPGNRTVVFGRDGAGRLTSVTPPGHQAHTFAYSPVGLLTVYGAPQVGGEANKTTFAYDIDKRLIRVGRADGKTVSFVYDAAGRVSSYAFDRGTTSLAYDSRSGQLSTIAAAGGQILTYSYDGALPRSEAWSGAVNATVVLAYDSSFRVSGISIGSDQLNYSYDDDDLLVGAGSLTIARRLTNGQPTSTTLLNTTDSIGYNAFDEPNSYSMSVNANVVYAASTGRDRLGRITEATEAIGGQQTTIAYSYDDAGRLTEVRRNGVSTESYGYDANGNRTTHGGLTGSASGTYDAQDRLTQYAEATYSYGVAGDLRTKTTSGQQTSYDYDALGNLRVVHLPGGKEIAYSIDGRNRRVAKSVNGSIVSRWVYQDDLHITAEVGSAGEVLTRFVYATGGPPLYMTRGGQIFRYVVDLTGSVRLVLNASTGEVVQRLSYDAFGDVVEDSNPGFQPFAFAGGLYDSDTRLSKFGARDYDPRVGRWTTKDAIGLAGGLNLYEYAMGDPINNQDASGLAGGRGTRGPGIDMPNIRDPDYLKNITEKVRHTLENFERANKNHFENILKSVKKAAKYGCKGAVEIAKPLLEKGIDLGRSAGEAIRLGTGSTLEMFPIIIINPDLFKSKPDYLASHRSGEVEPHSCTC